MAGTDFIRTNVLILGAGLAGLRAAWAVRQEISDFPLCVVSRRRGPCGSSFSNINDRLGMQVCLSDSEKEDFVREALAIAPPGEIDPVLTSILAEEGLARARDLESAGLVFRKDASGNLLRSNGCFSSLPRAVIFAGLSNAFHALKQRALSPGGRFLAGWMVQDLIRDESRGSARICGAILKKVPSGELLAVQAEAVVVALGGPASLFHMSVAGPGTSGVSHALLSRHGAPLVNQTFLQFMWHKVARREFWPVQNLVQPGWMFKRGEDVHQLPERFYSLIAERARHCPAGYGMADSVLDLYLMDALNDEACLTVYAPGEGWYATGLMAHAGNGGARIDSQGWTGVEGLYACGESASGMHGANRIGGAMVLATQVFGERAGRAAARYARQTNPLSEEGFRRAAEETISSLGEDNPEWIQTLPWIRWGLQRVAVLGGRPGLTDFLNQVRDRLRQSRDSRTRLALESALIIGCGAVT